MATLLKLERLRNTRDGNPMWRLYLPSGSCKTKANAACAHAISEYHVGRDVEVQTDERGEVIRYYAPPES